MYKNQYQDVNDLPENMLTYTTLWIQGGKDTYQKHKNTKVKKKIWQKYGLVYEQTG